MPFRSFHDLFPDVAERETRSITILPDSNLGLPSGDYGFLEMFCDESGCDCRRVILCAVSSSRQRTEAIIAWGWEDVEFYEKWMKCGDRADAEDLKGPILNTGSPETELAPALLELTRNVLLKDGDYVARVKRHYEMFRKSIDGREGNPSRNDPCPCGSGKKYKKCCLEADEGRKVAKSVCQKDEFEDLRTSVTDLDGLSNSVIDLIASRDFEKAEAVCQQLQEQYPDQVDGTWRLAMVHEARGDRPVAARLYREAADFMRTHKGFDEDSIAEMIQSAQRMETCRTIGKNF